MIHKYMWRLFITVLVVIPVFFASTGFAQMRKDTADYSGAFSPTWVQNRTWTQKVIYRKLALGKTHRKSTTEDLSEGNALLWDYRVSKVKTKDSVSLYRVHAKSADAQSRELAAITFAKQPAYGNSPHNLSLLNGKFLKYFRGKSDKDVVAVSSLRAKPLPVLTTNSSIIYDFPVFPVNVVDKATLSAEDLREKDLIRRKVYMITEDTGEQTLTYAMDIEQKEYRNPDPDAFCFKGVKESLTEAGLPTKDLVGVQLSRAFDNQVVRQLWHKSVPWPLASIGPWYKTLLVSEGMLDPKKVKANRKGTMTRLGRGKPRKVKAGKFDEGWHEGTDVSSPYSHDVQGADTGNLPPLPQQ